MGLGDLLTPLLGLLAVVGGLCAAWFAGKTKGAAKAEVKAAEQRTKDNEEVAAILVQQNKAASDSEVEAVVKANEQVEDVNAMSDDAVMRELRERWTAPAADNQNRSSN